MPTTRRTPDVRRISDPDKNLSFFSLNISIPTAGSNRIDSIRMPCVNMVSSILKKSKTPCEKNDGNGTVERKHC